MRPRRSDFSSAATRCTALPSIEISKVLRVLIPANDEDTLKQLVQSTSAAKAAGSPEITPAHLVLGLLSEPDGIGAGVEASR